MQFFTPIIAAIFAGAAFAAPTELDSRGAYTPCSGLYGNAQCCATDVLGVADLNCANPSAVPTSAANFESICSAEGQQAKCCAIPILGQDLLCETPIGL